MGRSRIPTPYMNNFLKRIPLFETFLVVTILGVHLYAALSDAYNFPNVWFKRDDAFYYFKVAQNISEGRGSTFDGINPTNGYHPLWLLVCIPIFSLARFDLILPLRVLLMVMAVLNAATAVLIFRLVKERLSLAAGMLAASFWAFHYYIHAVVYEYGLETGIAAFAVVYLVHELSRFEKEWRAESVPPKRIAGFALLAALVIFSRLDLVFLVVIAGAWIILRGKPIRSLLPLDMVAILASMTASVALRTGLDAYNHHYAYSALEAAALALVFKPAALYFFGAYRHPRANSSWGTLRQLAYALTAGGAVIVAIYLLLIELGFAANFPRSAFVLDWVISLIALFSLRLAATWFSRPGKVLPDESPLNEFKANWKTWLREGAVFYGITGALLGAYMLFNKIVFGVSSPISGLIKRWWGSMEITLYENPASNWYAFFGIGRTAYDAWMPLTDIFYWGSDVLRPLYPGADKAGDRYYIAMGLFVLLALIVLFVNKRRAANAFSNMALIPLAAGCGIHILSYTASSYGGAKEWYWVSQMVMLALGGGLLLDLLRKPLQRMQPARLPLQIAALLLCVYLARDFSLVISAVMPHGYFPPDRPYMEVLEYLEENTPPGSVIGMTGGGNVGYLIHDRTIVNMDGLINSYDYFQELKEGRAAPYLRERGMTIIFANPQLLTFPPYYGQFAPYLVKYSTYGGKSLLYVLEEPKY